jgi:hypothetical protein
MASQAIPLAAPVAPPFAGMVYDKDRRACLLGKQAQVSHDAHHIGGVFVGSPRDVPQVVYHAEASAHALDLSNQQAKIGEVAYVNDGGGDRDRVDRALLGEAMRAHQSAKALFEAVFAVVTVYPERRALLNLVGPVCTPAGLGIKPGNAPRYTQGAIQQ